MIKAESNYVVEVRQKMTDILDDSDHKRYKKAINTHFGSNFTYELLSDTDFYSFPNVGYDISISSGDTTLEMKGVSFDDQIPKIRGFFELLSALSKYLDYKPETIYVSDGLRDPEKNRNAIEQFKDKIYPNKESTLTHLDSSGDIVFILKSNIECDISDIINRLSKS